MINGELIIDNFAGGGGASTGIEMAIGKSVDIAINHDPEAIRMHKTNHPNTRHYCENVWTVNPVEACAGNPVGLAWFSPDCKHFSKAKGSKPVEKKIRGLAWIVLKWAALVRPRVIMLENVEEFQTWGPCIPVRDSETGRVIVNMADMRKKKNEPCTRVAEPGEVIPVDSQIFRPDPKRKGQTYRRWKKQLEDLGYVVEAKELVAADYGAPTTRKRFFLIARCDGKPIVWPEPTHAPRNSEAVRNGKLKPYVGAYTQIDFSRPCPSIFDTAEEIKKKYGIRAVRPLAPKTMERIAKGLKKFVLDNQEPFIVQVNHSGAKSDYCNSMNDPLKVITSKHGFGIVEPYVIQISQNGFAQDRSRSIEDPLSTVVAKNEHCLVNIKTVPYMGTNTTNHPGGSCKEPIHTITTGNQQCLISPTLIQYHSETSDSEVRGQQITDPVMTLDGSNRYGLVTSFLHKYYDGGYKGAGEAVENPLPTITPWDHNSLVTANLIQMNNHYDGRDIAEPLPTITAGGGHFGEVRAFLIKYYGESDAQDITEPLDTITSHDRFGLVTINGVDYQIIDIGLRMLEPEELYGCQGFPADYIIDQDYSGKKYSRSEQVKRCGNSVCPPIPAVLVKANLPELCVGERMPNLSMEMVKVDDGQQLSFA